MSPIVQIIAFSIALVGTLFTDWAVVANRFFSGVVRIQKDRGHAIIDTGPYHYVRHPGYAGAILHYIAAPIAIGSLWGIFPGIIVICITIIRTALEDRTLRKELDGYEQYSERVRFRLFPAIW